MAALGHIGKRAGIALCGVARERNAGSEVALSITKKDLGCELPVPALDQDDIRMPSPFRSPMLAFEDVSETVSRGTISKLALQPSISRRPQYIGAE
jgi:hypothetical protein